MEGESQREVPAQTQLMMGVQVQAERQSERNERNAVLGVYSSHCGSSTAANSEHVIEWTQCKPEGAQRKQETQSQQGAMNQE